MKLDLHYVDPRLVALYDLENARGIDTDFYCDLARELDARVIVDLGCGTGVLTRELATGGRRVFGVDPSEAMLAAARAHPGAERVEWIVGDATTLGPVGADLVVMTGNVAQVFLEDHDWVAALQAIRKWLGPGGHLAFECRNPAARGWEKWIRDETWERIDSPNGPMQCWLDLVAVEPGRVVFEGHNVFEDTGEVLVARSELRFRSHAEIDRSLTESGFEVQHVFGDWRRGPMRPSSPVMVFVARRA
ncbi:MAG: class I SAM-dependent methyltransferase [bacterium]